MAVGAFLLCSSLAVSPPPLTRRLILISVPAVAVFPHVARAAAPLFTPPAAVPGAAAAVAEAASPSAAAEFWSGLLAGAVQKTVKEIALHPLDTVKARLQIPGPRRDLITELLRAPYAGLAPALASGAPAASIFFAVKDALQRQCAVAGIGDKTASTLIAVAGANAAYWAIKNPAEVRPSQPRHISAHAHLSPGTA